MKKTEVLLVKKSMVEAVISALASREPQQQAQAGTTHKAEGMWEQMMKQWEALTQMRVENGVAIIPLRGAITPDDPFAAMYGETNLNTFNKNFDEALADSKVKAIVTTIFSPGGYVYGVEATANRIYDARGKKPLIAYTDTLAASAGYWIASAFDQIVLGSETAEVGSIGVYLVHFDYSEMLAKEGIKVTEVTSGEFKGIGSPYAAMTDAEKKELQKDSNYVYTRFVDTVARNRGKAVEDVLKSANGLTFYGSEAIKAGLADSINSLQETIAMATDNKGTTKTAAEIEAEEKQAAKAAEEKAAMQAQLDLQAAQIKTMTEKAAKEASDRATAECKAAVKQAYGREATEEEVKFYVALGEDGRKVYKASLAEAASNIDRIAKKAGLTTEQVTAASDEELNELGTGKNLIVDAMRDMGLADAPAKK